MKKLIPFLICLCLLASGCKQPDYAINVGGLTITENDISRQTALLRATYLANSGEEDTKKFWNEKMEDGSTMSQVFTDSVQQYLINNKLYSLQFERLGLSFTAEEEENLTRLLSEQSVEAGGMSALSQQLEEEGYTYEEYLTEIYDTAKKSKVLNHYFGAGGEFETSDQDIKNYYNVHNALVKVIFLMKYDPSTGELLPESERQEAAKKAEDAYISATRPASTDLFPDLISMYSQDTSTAETGIVISDNGDFQEEIYKAALALEVGDVTKLETADSYLVLKRYDGTSDAVFDGVTRQSTLETLRADEIKTLLGQWESEAKIERNSKLLKKYKPENFCDE